MNGRWQHHAGLEVILRMVADALMINAALLIALVLRYVWSIETEEAALPTTLRSYIEAYLRSVWLLTSMSLVIFYFCGLYTRSRKYRGRYKALVVAQATSLSYLLFGFLALFFPQAIWLPRGALLPAWVLTLIFLIGARLWLTLWDRLVQDTNYLLPPASTDTRMKQVLVIGGAGYIGSALLPRLLDAGYRVRLLDLLLFGTEPIAQVINHPRLEIVQADFRQVDQVVQAMRGVEMVVHLGAIVGDPACALDAELTIEINLMATRMIAEVAKGSGVKQFVFASTCSVYGASEEILDERSLLNPVSLYARSKIASETVLQKMADEQFAPVILRFATIYGLSGRTRFDLVVNLLTAKAAVDGQITIHGGDQWRPFVHVDDAAGAITAILAADARLVRNQIFNVGSDAQNYTITQLGEIIHRLVPTAELIVVSPDADRRNYRVSFSKIQHLLGFMPQYTVEQGIQQVIDAINSGKVQDYRDARYSNVKFLDMTGTARLIRHEHSWAYALLNDMSLLHNSDEQAPPVESLQARVVGAK